MAVQDCRGPFQHFDPVDVGKVPEVHRFIPDAIEVLVVLRAEAANVDLVALTVSHRRAYPGDIQERILDRPGAL